MSLSKKSILLVCEEPDLVQSTTDALKPVVKSLVHAKTEAEAMLKAKNQVFDAFIVRIKPATLDRTDGIYGAVQNSKEYPSTTPWIVLGKDIENEAILVKNRSVKFVNEPANGAGLIKLLEGVFFGEEGGDKGKIDVSFINPLVGAVVSVLQSMGKIKLQRLDPYLKKMGSTAHHADITGIIAMNSDRFLGSLAISYPEAVILNIYKNMLGSGVPTINDDVKDAVAELTNVIFGNAKRDLNELGHTILPAIPSVVSGKGHEVRHNVQGTCLVIPFETEGGKILVECIISPK